MTEGGGGGGGAGPDGASRVGRILDGVLDRLGLREELEDQDVLRRWEEVVGERISSVTRARAFHRGVLFVEVRSSAWLNELGLMKRELLRRINEDADRAPVEKLVFTLEERS